MRKRNVDKHIWFDRQEAQDLQKKAKKACLTEAALIRLLIRGYEPREKPDERFYDAMRELSAIGNNINQLAIKAVSYTHLDVYKRQITELLVLPEYQKQGVGSKLLQLAKDNTPTMLYLSLIHI